MLHMITVIKVKQSCMFGSTVILVKEKIRHTFPTKSVKILKKFYDGGEKIDFVSDKRKHSATSSHEFPCTDESCILTF